jgi:acetyl esterase
MLRKLRMRAGALVVDNFFAGISRAGRMHPRARPERHRVEVIRDVAYQGGGREEHLLDVYRPSEAQGAKAPWPVVLYVHGGGFRILSKDTHWIMGLAFARRGYIVFNINYRLAPKHPFPAAIEDAAAAYAWVVKNAASWGGDPSRLVLAGESAGANLATALAVAASYPRAESWARPVWESGVSPRAVMAACGILQVSDPDRFVRGGMLPPLLSPIYRDRIDEVSLAYLARSTARGSERDLADPLVVLERGERPARPLPPFFAPVGTWDPVLDDTRRLKRALDRLGVVCAAPEYEKELHAFIALIFRRNARRCWLDAYRFLEQALDGSVQKMHTA